MFTPLTHPRSSDSRRNLRLRPEIELLDERSLPTGISLLPGGVLEIEGSDFHDQARVVLRTGLVRASLRSRDGSGALVSAPIVMNFASASVTRITFTGLVGNDNLRNDTAFALTAWGGTGNDTIRGGLASDVILGQDNNDLLIGAAGNDTIWAGSGDDTIRGQMGQDFLHGGHGNDDIIGGQDDDFMSDLQTIFEAGSGDEVMVGGGGNDTMAGAGGFDILNGGAGSDSLSGGSFDGFADWLIGGTEADDFVVDWFWDGFGWANRDNPLDLNTFEGDVVV